MVCDRENPYKYYGPCNHQLRKKAHGSKGCWNLSVYYLSSTISQYIGSSPGCISALFHKLHFETVAFTFTILYFTVCTHSLR